MNRRALVPGTIFNSYRDMCRKLKIPVKQGNSKSSQLIQIRRYCDLQKADKGNSYKVVSVYDKPLPDITLGRKGLYQPFIENILLAYFIDKGTTSVTLTKNKFYEILAFINENYLKYSNGKNRASLQNLAVQNSHVFLSDWIIEEFYKKSNQKFRSVLKHALDSLQNKMLIKYTDSYLGYRTTITPGATPIKKFEEVSDADVELILQYSKKVAAEMGFDSWQELYNPKPVDEFDNLYERLNEFRTKVNKIVKDELGYECVVNAYHVVCNRKYLQMEYDKNVQKMKDELNHIVRDKLYNSESDKVNNGSLDNLDLVNSDKYLLEFKYLIDLTMDQEHLIPTLENVDVGVELDEFDKKIASFKGDSQNTQKTNLRNRNAV